MELECDKKFAQAYGFVRLFFHLSIVFTLIFFTLYFVTNQIHYLAIGITGILILICYIWVIRVMKKELNDAWRDEDDI